MSDDSTKAGEKQKVSFSKKEVAFSVLGLLIIIGMLVLAFLFRKDLEVSENFSSYSLIGIFIISLIACSLISITLIPIYYLMVVFYVPSILAASWGLLAPVWVGAVAGLGATMGQLPTFLIAYKSGRLTEKLLSRISVKAYEKASTWAKKYGGAAVFTVSVIPNPINLPLTLAIATTKYSPYRWAFFALAGNLIKCIVVAFAGYYGVEFIEHLID